MKNGNDMSYIEGSLRQAKLPFQAGLRTFKKINRFVPHMRDTTSAGKFARKPLRTHQKCLKLTP